jgi:hypothetical protein
MFAANLVREMVLQMMDLAQNDPCIIDSLLAHQFNIECTLPVSSRARALGCMPI